MLASVNHWPNLYVALIPLGIAVLMSAILLGIFYAQHRFVFAETTKKLLILCGLAAIVSAGLFVYAAHNDYGEVHLTDAQRQSLAHQSGFERMEGTAKFVAPSSDTAKDIGDAPTFVRSDGTRTRCALIASTADQSWWGTSKVKINQVVCATATTGHPVK